MVCKMKRSVMYKFSYRCTKKAPLNFNENCFRGTNHNNCVASRFTSLLSGSMNMLSCVFPTGQTRSIHPQRLPHHQSITTSSMSSHQSRAHFWKKRKSYWNYTENRSDYISLIYGIQWINSSHFNSLKFSSCFSGTYSFYLKKQGSIFYISEVFKL